MQDDREENRDRHDAEQGARVGRGDGRKREAEVVDRPDSANPEPGDEEALPPR